MRSPLLARRCQVLRMLRDPASARVRLASLTSFRRGRDGASGWSVGRTVARSGLLSGFSRLTSPRHAGVGVGLGTERRTGRAEKLIARSARVF